MTPAKKAELILKHAAARRRLRAEGREESLGNVLGIAGGSKRDIVALWNESDPDTAPLPMTDAEANFRQTFADYLAAATRFNAIATKPFDLPSRHPWRQELEEAARQAYKNHIAAWNTLEGYEEAQRPAPEPAPPPPPPPAFDMPNLRAYYKNRFESPWPNGAHLPVTAEMYHTLQQLWKECDEGMVQAQITGRRIQNEQRALGSTGDDHPPVREQEAKRGTFGMMAHAIKSDMERLQDRARAEGRTL